MSHDGAPSWLTNQQIRAQMAAILSMPEPERLLNPATPEEAFNDWVNATAITGQRVQAYARLRTVLYKRGALGPSAEWLRAGRSRSIA